MIGTVTWKELRSQPDAWERLLARISVRDSLPGISLDELGELGESKLQEQEQELRPLQPLQPREC